MYNGSSSPTLLNCIFWGDTSNGTREIQNSVSAPTVTNSIVQGGYPGTGNLDVDPLLISNYNYRLQLQMGSPAIDSGACGSTVSSTDILGNPRWDLARVANAAGSNGVDMGAHEYQGATGVDAMVTSVTCP